MTSLSEKNPIPILTKGWIHTQESIKRQICYSRKEALNGKEITAIEGDNTTKSFKRNL